MATWDITVSAGSTVGSGTDVLLTTISGVVPGDFDGSTINSVTVQGTPTVTSDGTTDDTIGVRFFVTTTVPADTFGGDGSDAASMCYAVIGNGVSSANITDGSARSPNPTTAVAADWDEVRYSINYSASKKNDGETISWSSFTVRVTYTPGAQEFTENHSMTATGTSVLSSTVSYVRSLSHSATGTSAVQKAITLGAKALTATGTSVLSKGLQFMQNQAMTATGTAVLSQTITYFQGLAHSATGTPVLSTIKSYVQALAHSAVGTSVLSSVKSFLRSFSQSATGTPSVSKETGKQPAHSATGSVATSVAVTYTTSLSYTATGTSVSEQTFVPDAGPSVIKKAIRTGMGFARRFSWRG